MQTKGDGRSIFVTDYFAGGLRGYAASMSCLPMPAGRAILARHGEGALAITIEPKRGAQPCQGLCRCRRRAAASARFILHRASSS